MIIKIGGLENKWENEITKSVVAWQRAMQNWNRKRVVKKNVKRRDRISMREKIEVWKTEFYNRKEAIREETR